MRFLGLAMTAALVACGDSDGEGTDDSGSSGGIEDLTVAELGIATAREVRWTTASAGRSFVEYGVEGAFDRVTPMTAEGTAHSVKLLLLKANHDYQARAVTELSDGTRLESAPVTIEVAPPPQKMPKLTMDLLDAASEVVTGYVLTTTLGSGPSFVGVVDGEGDWVWWAEMAAADLSTARARLSRDGRSVLYNVYQTDKKADQGWIVRKSLDGVEETWTRTLWAHHDFVELPEGRFGWLGYDQRMVDQVGGTPALDVGDGPFPIATDVVYEGPEGMTEADTPTSVWGYFDDYAMDPFWVCEDMTVANLDNSFLPGWYDWTHSNSLAYVDANDSYYLGTRYLDTLLRIGRDGTLHWELGGALDDFTWTGLPFQHSHVSDIWADGMLMFDNRDHSGDPSRIIEVRWDETGMTADVVWEFPRADGETLHILGDARRMPGGNVLVAWSQRGEMAEVTPGGEVLFRGTMGLGSILTRVEFFTDADIAP